MTEAIVRTVPTVLSMYSVLPCKLENGIVCCEYWDAEYNRVPANELNCRAQKGNVDFVCLYQPLSTSVPSNVRAECTPLENVTLFAAVVNTIGDNDVLPKIFLADDQRRLMLPVMPQTRRAVILIFSLTSGDGVTGLVASADPEIKNSTDGLPLPHRQEQD